MTLIDDIDAFAAGFGATSSEKKGIHTIRKTIAERKVFLSKKRLEYIAKLRVDDGARQVKFTEMLKESGSGISSGGMDYDDGMTAGHGFKTESYEVGLGGREGSIAEQSTLFGKDYTYTFDYSDVRSGIESLAQSAGYAFAYQITPIGL
jgi:hypothetical protein